MDKLTDKQPSIRKLCPTCGQVSIEHSATQCAADGSTLVVFPQDALIGNTIVDRYYLRSLIGEGGWSTVYKANDNSLGRIVAVKVMQAHLLTHADRIMRFKREAMAISAFTHTNMRAIYDCGVLPSGQPFMIMEYLDGQTLSEVLDAEGSLSVRRVVDISIQICDALQSAHEKGIIHRDVKPSNIMLLARADHTDLVKVMDFGVAKFTDSAGHADLTTTGETVGTAAYMSPEQCLGKDPEPRSDIYSLGCVMYEAVTGRKAIDGRANQCMFNHINQIPRRFSEVRSDLYIPQFLESIVLRALQKDPADRFESLAEMADALRAGKKVEITATPPESTAPSVAASVRKNALPLAALTITLVCLVYCVLAVMNGGSSTTTTTSSSSSSSSSSLSPPHSPKAETKNLVSSIKPVAHGVHVPSASVIGPAVTVKAEDPRALDSGKHAPTSASDKAAAINRAALARKEKTVPTAAPIISSVPSAPLKMPSSPVAAAQNKLMKPAQVKPVAPAQNKPVAPAQNKPVAQAQNKPVLAITQQNLSQAAVELKPTESYWKAKLVGSEKPAPDSVAPSTGPAQRSVASASTSGPSVIPETLTRRESQPPPTLSDNLDRKLVRFQAQTDLTQQVCEAVVEGLALLPRDLKQRFIDAGVTVVITPTMQQFHNKSGLPDYDPAIKTVVICERNAGGAGGTLRRGDIKTLHEFGHAFDQMVGYPSRDSKFRTVYSQEVAAVPMADRNLLSTFIQGDPVGPRECFASLFASLYYRGADSRLATLKADFPNCLRLVREMQR